MPRPSRLACAAAAILVLTASARAHARERDAAPPPPGPPPLEITWRIIVPDRPKFTGAIAPGEAAWLPPGERFWVARSLGGKTDTTAKITAPAAFIAAGGADGGRHGDSFVFRSPTRPGAYTLQWGSAKAFDLLVLTAARMTCTKTASGQKITVTLGRASIGSYPDPTAAKSKRVRDNAPRYIPPLWYFRFDSRTEAIRLSPSVTVGHMVGFIGRGRATRKGRRHVTYFPPSRALVRKLEAMVSLLEKKGVAARRGLILTSGFRTPKYNAKVGGSGFSRHAFGDGADVIIDASPVDGRMDDLNRDGRIDWLDGKMVADAAREAELSGDAVPGGIGLYEYIDPNSVLCHVHVDARGYLTRWGTTYRTGKARKLRWWPEWEFPEEDDDE